MRSRLGAAEAEPLITGGPADRHHGAPSRDTRFESSRSRNRLSDQTGFSARFGSSKHYSTAVLATVLFTDDIGSTDKACQVGDAWSTRLFKAHDQG